MPTHKSSANVGPYQLFMLALSVWALSILGADTFFSFDEETKIILQYADNVVCALFLLDFVLNTLRASNRLRYLATWGWIDLLSSIPMIDAFRLGRAARVIRIVRVIRAMKSARALAQYIISKRAESAALSTVLVTILVVVFSSIAVLQFEMPQGGNIQSAEDAMWWSISTMTTVGYGDRFPITSEGRLIAVFLMAAGFGVFGTLSGLIAAWFLSPAAAETDSDLTELKQLITTLQSSVEQLANVRAAATPSESDGPSGRV